MCMPLGKGAPGPFICLFNEEKACHVNSKLNCRGLRQRLSHGVDLYLLCRYLRDFLWKTYWFEDSLVSYWTVLTTYVSQLNGWQVAALTVHGTLATQPLRFQWLRPMKVRRSTETQAWKRIISCSLIRLVDLKFPFFFMRLMYEANMKALLFVLVICVRYAATAKTSNETSNETVTAPLTTCANHGDPTLCCRSAKWTDLVVFYLGNYVAHAATTRLAPGQDLFDSLFTILGALLYPLSGLGRGIQAVYSRAIFAETELQAAARAGALFMIMEAEYMKTSWADCAYCNMDSYAVEADLKLAIRRRMPGIFLPKFHGRCILPDGYGIVQVPSNALFEDDVPDSRCMSCYKSIGDELIK